MSLMELAMKDQKSAERLGLKAGFACIDYHEPHRRRQPAQTVGSAVLRGAPVRGGMDNRRIKP